MHHRHVDTPAPLSLQERIAANLRQLRLMSGLSQEQVGTAVSISRTKYNRIEKGHTCPDIITMCSLLAFYDITLEELLNISQTSSENKSK